MSQKMMLLLHEGKDKFDTCQCWNCKLRRSYVARLRASTKEVCERIHRSERVRAEDLSRMVY